MRWTSMRWEISYAVFCLKKKQQVLAQEEHAMTLASRKILHLTASAAALPSLSRVSRADTYPSHPVRILVGFAGCSTTDILGRLIGQWLSYRLGQQFVVENRPGRSE